MNQTILSELQPVFFPRSIAIVGASDKDRSFGLYWLKSLLDVGFTGRIYPVNPGRGKVLGLKTYPDLLSIPDSIDYVIISTTQKSIIDTLDDCVAKGVKIVHIFTAGFKETGSEAGHLLETQIVKKAREGKFRVIGPNCIGVYCQQNRMPVCNSNQLGEPGTIAFISQSGGHTQRLFDTGLQRRIHFNKMVSLGNSCDLNAVDFMEYFAADPQIKIIAAYLEGVSNGRAFFELSCKITKRKPLIIWKGGMSQAGAKAAASHTGSLAGSDIVWAAALTQARALSVKSLEELTDTLLAFQNLPPCTGRKVAIIAIAAAGGGIGVTSSDSCSDLGLEVAPLSDETRSELDSFVSPIGQSTNNPLDVPFSSTQPDDLWKILKLLEADSNIDLIILYENIYAALSYSGEKAITTANDITMHFSKVTKKPFVVVSEHTLDDPIASAMETDLVKADVCVFPTIERAAKAIFNLTQYWKFREKTGTSNR